MSLVSLPAIVVAFVACALEHVKIDGVLAPQIQEDSIEIPEKRVPNLFVKQSGDVLVRLFLRRSRATEHGRNR